LPREVYKLRRFQATNAASEDYCSMMKLAMADKQMAMSPSILSKFV
jgi:hypothetical protein